MRIGGTGHRQLPPGTAELVRHSLSELVTAHRETGLTGVTCLADGADQFFAEAVLAAGGSLEVIIPSDGYRESLPPNYWPDYDRLVQQARSITRLEYSQSTSDAHMAASQLMVDGVDLLVAVWDGLPARGYGGTADVVAYAERRGVPVCVLWPVGARRD